MRSLYFWLSPLLSVPFLYACEPLGTSPVETVCEPAATRRCIGDGDCSGHKTCNDEGDGFSSCQCDDGGAEPDVLHSLGAQCAKDEQCPTGAFCLTADKAEFFGGGPPSGVCVAECFGGRCDAFADAVCTDVGGGRSLCLETCSLGTRDSERCHGRRDAACEGRGSEATGVCRPFCSRNADCPAGHCDPSTGACVTAGAAGESDFGQQCSKESDGGAARCSGLCVNVSDRFAACSHRCVFGRTEDCSLLEGVRGGCLIASQKGSIGDVGYCAALCESQADCERFGKKCEPFGDPVLESAFKAQGACTGF